MTEFATAAAEIADELVAAADPAGTWTSDTMLVRGGASAGIIHEAAGHDLYGGGGGIAWFLAHHARQTGSPTQSRCARAALTVAARASEDMVRQQHLSLYAGASGVALAMKESARALNDRALSNAAVQLAEGIADAACAKSVKETDLIGGKAGIIVALLAFSRARLQPGAIRRAIRIIAEQLVDEADEGWWGAAWPEGEDPGLCGLGHGASGIGWALSEAAAHLGDDRLRDVGQAALRYEAGRFDPRQGSWPDMRGMGEGKPAGRMDAWCHGAIGIGAVRWRMWQTLREPRMLAQATAAMGATRRLVVDASRAGPDARVDVTLCHGLGGAAELMLLAHEITGRAEHLAAARKVGRLMLRLRRPDGRWTVGLAGGEDVPGLFLGRAGIGATFLRLHDPRVMPSPLLAGLAQPLRLTAVSQAVALDVTHPI